MSDISSISEALQRTESNSLPADALVLFGATGDIAYKKFSPSLQAMVKSGRLEVPVI